MSLCFNDKNKATAIFSQQMNLLHCDIPPILVSEPNCIGDNLTQSTVAPLSMEYMATNICRNEFFLARYVTCGFSDLVLRIVASALLKHGQSESLSTPRCSHAYRCNDCFNDSPYTLRGCVPFHIHLRSINYGLSPVTRNDHKPGLVHITPFCLLSRCVPSVPPCPGAIPTRPVRTLWDT